MYSVTGPGLYALLNRINSTTNGRSAARKLHKLKPPTPDNYALHACKLYIHYITFCFSEPLKCLVNPIFRLHLVLQKNGLLGHLQSTSVQIFFFVKQKSQSANGPISIVYLQIVTIKIILNMQRSISICGRAKQALVIKNKTCLILFLCLNWFEYRSLASLFRI